MKTVQVMIAESFSAGDVITTKIIREKYKASSSYAQHIMSILTRVNAVNKMNIKDGSFSQYVIKSDAYKKVMAFEQRAKAFRPKTNRNTKWSREEAVKGHDPLILMFDKLLAEVRLWKVLLYYS
nr:hypothetical protein [Providencia sp.]